MNGNGNGNGTTNGSKSSSGGKRSGLKLALGKRSELAQTAPANETSDGKLTRIESFDQPVILQQTNFWSRAIVWGIVGVTSAVVLWASVAKIEEAVPAVGQLKPQNQVQPVQAPIGGVVEAIYVKDGQRVKQGDLLIRLDPTTSEAQQRSLEQQRTSLQRQNQFYRAQLSNTGTINTAELKALNLPPEIVSLTENRGALLAENQLYQVQLTGSAQGANLTPDQISRIRAGLLESQTRAEAARLDTSQLQQQLDQAKSELVAAQKSFNIDQSVYNDLLPLLQNGGISRIQVVKQEQQVIQSKAEVDKQTLEVQRLQYAIAQSQEKLQNTMAQTDTDLMGKMADNNKKIADIDSQLNKAIIDNENQIADITSKLSETQVNLKYQELRAPVDGVVFDLQAKGVGFVANTSEPILKVVPNNALRAEVYITNQDIGFVREGMPADVRVDSFPFSEFGDLHGKLVDIGSDALPPDQEHPFYRFPAQVEIDQQFINVNGKEVPLQSGMSVTTNIITRKRSVMSIFLDMFSRKVDSIKNVR